MLGSLEERATATVRVVRATIVALTGALAACSAVETVFVFTGVGLSHPIPPAHPQMGCYHSDI